MIQLPRWTRIVGLWLVVLAGLAFGCRRSESLHCVRGSVRFVDGSKVTFGTVECYSPTRQRSARARVEPDGTFQIGSKSGRDGVVDGTHHVLVRQSGTAVGLTAEHAQHVRFVHPRYQSYETSGLTWEVAAAEAVTEVELVLEPAPPR